MIVMAKRKELWRINLQIFTWMFPTDAVCACSWKFWCWKMQREFPHFPKTHTKRQVLASGAQYVVLKPYLPRGVSL